MRLRDLDAAFIGHVNLETRTRRQQEGIDGAQGVMFQCPKCAVGRPACDGNFGGRAIMGAHYVLCWFRNPRGAPRVPDTMEPHGRWNTSDESTGLDDLTFVGPEQCSVKITAGCDWHGYIRGGEATLQ